MRIILSICLGLMFSFGFSQDKIYDFPDKESVFIGGAGALQKYISENVEYPEKAIENNVEGKVFVAFVVEKDGTVTTINIERGVDELLNFEARRLVQNSSKMWVPGEMKGEVVRTRVRLPINFTIHADSDKKESTEPKNQEVIKVIVPTQVD